jgi:uroporphyrinogen-III decarboxylase
MASAVDAIKFGKILDRFAEATLSVIKGWCELDFVELITIHDDIASTKGIMMQPDWYREYIFPWYREFFKTVHDKGKKVVYISDGNYFQLIDDILDTGPDGLFIESSSLEPEEVMRAGGNKLIYHLKTDNRNIDVGTPEDIYEEIKRIRELNEKYPAIFMYRGGGNKNEKNIRAFDKKYQELLVYE